MYGRDRLLFCFAVVQSLCTIRDGPLEIPVHELFFCSQSFCSMWKVYCLDGVLLARIFVLEKFPLQELFLRIVNPPPPSPLPGFLMVRL